MIAYRTTMAHVETMFCHWKLILDACLIYEERNVSVRTLQQLGEGLAMNAKECKNVRMSTILFGL